MAKLRVNRKGFIGKHGKLKGIQVSSVTFLIMDRGKKGRGKKIFPPLEKGALGISFNTSASARRRKLAKLARRVGEKTVMGRLQALVVYNKNTNPDISRKAAADRSWIAKNFIGRKKVRPPRGLSR